MNWWIGIFLHSLNVVRPGRPEQWRTQGPGHPHQERLNVVRPGRPEQSDQLAAERRPAGQGLNVVRPGRPEQFSWWGFWQLSLRLRLNVVRPGRPEQSKIVMDFFRGSKSQCSPAWKTGTISKEVRALACQPVSQCSPAWKTGTIGKHTPLK